MREDHRDSIDTKMIIRRHNKNFKPKYFKNWSEMDKIPRSAKFTQREIDNWNSVI